MRVLRTEEDYFLLNVPPGWLPPQLSGTTGTGHMLTNSRGGNFVPDFL